MTKILPFYNGIYSQWYMRSFKIDDIEYNCCEQYMMAKKAKIFCDDKNYDLIMNSSNPRDQKKYGRKINNFDLEEWKKHNYKIIVDANYAKFSQNEDLKKELLNTGNNIICEASPYDKIYGIGIKKSDPDVHDQSKWKGTNLLGKAIMDAREKIKKENK